MNDENNDFDPELERRSRRNKIGVTIGFIALIVMTLIMAQLLVSIVKPVQSPTGTPPAVETPAQEEP